MKQVGVEGTDNDAMSSKKNSQYGIHFFRTNADYMRYLAEEPQHSCWKQSCIAKECEEHNPLHSEG
ncbi:hypothetical protein NXV57_29335 [Bacteroides thetaiotaomicron]|nr:hypothetical protein [Bacteroides thetaiotaomicron]